MHNQNRKRTLLVPPLIPLYPYTSIPYIYHIPYTLYLSSHFEVSSPLKANDINVKPATFIFREFIS